MTVSGNGVTGAYREPQLFARWLTTVPAVVWVALGVASEVQGHERWYLVLGLAYACLAGVTWWAPPTVVDEEGVRRPLRRLIAWADVDDVEPPRPGQRRPRLLLRDGRSVVVPGFPPERAAELRTFARAQTVARHGEIGD